ERAVARARERLGPRMEILWVLPDYYEEFPKPCMGGWGREAMVITPNGDVLPCQAAATIPGLVFDNVRERPLADIWFESEAFERFRGTDWMPQRPQSPRSASDGTSVTSEPSRRSISKSGPASSSASSARTARARRRRSAC